MEIAPHKIIGGAKDCFVYKLTNYFNQYAIGNSINSIGFIKIRIIISGKFRSTFAFDRLHARSQRACRDSSVFAEVIDSDLYANSVGL